MAALAAGIDDTGEQGEDPGADVGTGTVAEFADDDPVPPGTFSLVVGEREFRVGQDPEVCGSAGFGSTGSATFGSAAVGSSSASVSPVEAAPASRSQGARLLGGRELLVGP
jgi:hypothetical protein